MGTAPRHPAGHDQFRLAKSLGVMAARDASRTIPQGLFLGWIAALTAQGRARAHGLELHQVATGLPLE